MEKNPFFVSSYCKISVLGLNYRMFVLFYKKMSVIVCPEKNSSG